MPDLETHQKSRTMTWLVALAVLALLLFAAWQVAMPHSNEPSSFVTAGQAETFTEVPLPAAATHIRIAEYHHWIQFEQYMRFEAPPEVCLAYAEKILPKRTLQPVGEEEFKSMTYPLVKGAFTDLSWFDPTAAKHLVTAGGGPSVPQIWIDQDRGVFYFRKTD